MRAVGVRRAPLINQIALLLMAILIVYLVVDFGRQVVVSQHIQDDLQSVERDIQRVEADKAALEKRLAWARSPAAAEAWARRMGWALDDEVPLRIVAPEAGASSAVDVVDHRDLSLNSARDAWWDLFFGNR